MIRYYLDSNIFQYLKKDHGAYRKELREAVDNCKGKLLFPFSDAHLEDLKTSLPQYRDTDLAFMENYVRDNYFSTDVQSNFEFLLKTPSEAYKKDYDVVDDLFSDPQKFPKLLEELGDFEGADLLKGLFDKLLSTPLGELGPTLNMDTLTPESKGMLLKFLPDYGQNMTLGQFWQNNLSYSAKFLEDKDEVKALRQYVANGINRDDYSWDKWKAEFNEKLRDTPIGKSFMEMIDGILLESQKDNLYLKVTYIYSLLEMYNITQERTNKGLKKFTFSSLTQDAHHAYFASFADFLITDDRGLQLKAFILYDLLKLPVKVLSIDEFLQLQEAIQQQEMNALDFLAAFINDIRRVNERAVAPDPETGRIVKTGDASQAHLNYFNQIQIVQDDTATNYCMFCRRNTHADFAMYREIELIVNKLVHMFGPDSNGNGNYDLETERDIIVLREWNLSKVNLLLQTHNGLLALFLF